MKATELRLGNYITTLKNNGNWEIKQISKGAELDFINDNNFDFDIYKSVPLTSEWLKDLGLEWDIYWQGFTDGNWVLTENDSNGFRIAYGKRKDYPIHYNLQTVHELQNLYFALTGKELIKTN